MGLAAGFSQDEMRGSFAERSQVYRLLSSVFMKEVDAAFLVALRQCDMSGNEDLSSFIASLSGVREEDVLLDLKADFAALFLNMSARPVFTSESVYLSDEHVLMGEQRDEVLAEYRKAGFGLAEFFREPEDHISVELAFMGMLCERALGAADLSVTVDDILETQRRFLGEHLSRWAPLFCEAALSSARTAFYRGMAGLLEAFVEEECALLDVTIER